MLTFRAYHTPSSVDRAMLRKTGTGVSVSIETRWTESIAASKRLMFMDLVVMLMQGMVAAENML